MNDLRQVRAIAHACMRRLQIRICGLGQFFLTWVGADPGQTNLARPYPTLRAVCLDWIQTFGLKSVVLTWFNLISPAQHYFASVTGCGIAQYTLKFYQYDWNMLKSILNTLNRRTGRTVRATRNDARAIELRTDTTVERCARRRAASHAHWPPRAHKMADLSQRSWRRARASRQQVRRRIRRVERRRDAAAAELDEGGQVGREARVDVVEALEAVDAIVRLRLR